MKRNYILAMFCVGILSLNSCTQSSTDTNNDNNVALDKTYLNPSGGDPRGDYSPNTPFIFILNPDDSLTVCYGIGSLQMHGSTSDSGDYFLQLTARVRTKRMGDLYTHDTESDTIRGTWKVNGKEISFTDSGFTRTSKYTRDSKGFYLIYQNLSSFPPMSKQLLLLLDGASPDSTVWAFKRNSQ